MQNRKYESVVTGPATSSSGTSMQCTAQIMPKFHAVSTTRPPWDLVSGTLFVAGCLDLLEMLNLLPAAFQQRAGSQVGSVSPPVMFRCEAHHLYLVGCLLHHLMSTPALSSGGCCRPLTLVPGSQIA
jgi:hypothetical protein